MTEKQLNEALKEFGREHRATDAPDSLERVLYAAAESRKSAIAKPRMQSPWAWAAVAIVLVVVMASGAIWRSLETHQKDQSDQADQSGRSDQSQAQQAHSLPAPKASPGPLHSSPVTARLSVQPHAEPLRKAVQARVPLRHSAPDASTPSSLDAFVPLPASEGLPTAAELSIVRIRLRGSDLQQYGLQSPADALAKTMLAEFAVGEDGLPRAIRIVR